MSEGRILRLGVRLPRETGPTLERSSRPSKGAKTPCFLGFSTHRRRHGEQPLIDPPLADIPEAYKKEDRAEASQRSEAQDDGHPRGPVHATVQQIGTIR
jgi:hypothetical protein